MFKHGDVVMFTKDCTDHRRAFVQAGFIGLIGEVVNPNVVYVDSKSGHWYDVNFIALTNDQAADVLEVL